jgi:hypothetical protein
VTDWHIGYVVTLAESVRADDAEATVTAIRQIKGVIDVQPVSAQVTRDVIAKNRADQRWIDGIQELVDEIAFGRQRRNI